MKLVSATIAGLVAGEIVLNREKLTDFTTVWTWTGDEPLPETRERVFFAPNYKGTLQVNIAGEKLKWTASGDTTYHGHEYTPPWLPATTHDKVAEIVIDGTTGQATLSNTFTASVGPGKIDVDSCFHVQIPSRMVPPSQSLMAHVNDAFDQASGFLNHVEHTTSENGDLVYEHLGPKKESFAIQSDGTPVYFKSEFVCDASCQSYYGPQPSRKTTLTFDSFTKGAGDVTVSSCSDSSVLELTEMPEESKQSLMRVADLFDAQMDQIAKSAGISMPSLRAALEQQQLLADQLQSQGAQQTWKVGLLAGVAGMVGGAVVLALDKVFKRRQTPLLSEA